MDILSPLRPSQAISMYANHIRDFNFKPLAILTTFAPFVAALTAFPDAATAAPLLDLLELDLLALPVLAAAVELEADAVELEADADESEADAVELDAEADPAMLLAAPCWATTQLENPPAVMNCTRQRSLAAPPVHVVLSGITATMGCVEPAMA